MRGESPSGVASCLISECCSFPLKSAHADDVVGAVIAAGCCVNASFTPSESGECGRPEQPLGSLVTLEDSGQVAGLGCQEGWLAGPGLLGWPGLPGLPQT